ncbi:hypothetical protein Vau01_065220 [Virgisporangium aurantiacum]|uniref:Uncharacterized protein n=1 Tax=Virgisporangium aurantiacum TaxID=175570 RepID=A0A8J4E2I7_9ACTN|nr:hypothetical protein Vau01_065220 [Virgisporangium aurantiacum]
MRQALAARVGEREDLRRPAPAAGRGGGLLAGENQAVGEHGVEVTADARRAQPQRTAQLGGRGGTPFEQKLGETITGAPVGTTRGAHSGDGWRLPRKQHHVFHNTNVT